MLRKIRIALAVVFWLGITLLLLDFTGALHGWLGWMAKIQFLPAVMALNVAVIVGLVLLTLVFGRVYCSVICPLGVFQDGVAHLNVARKRKHKNRKPYSYSPEMKWLRYGVWALFVIALIVGVQALVALLAPYSAWGRIVQNLFQPVYLWVNNLFATLAERANSYTFYDKEVWLRSLPTFIVAAVTLVVVVVLAWRNGRTYCNTICPVVRDVPSDDRRERVQGLQAVRTQLQGLLHRRGEPQDRLLPLRGLLQLHRHLQVRRAEVPVRLGEERFFGFASE